MSWGVVPGGMVLDEIDTCKTDHNCHFLCDNLFPQREQRFLKLSLRPLKPLEIYSNLWSQIVDNIRDSFRGVDFSCHGVVSCLVVGWTTLVIGWSSLVMERPSLVVGWLSLVMGWPSLVMEQSSLVVGWSSLVVVGSSFVVGGNP